jgi:hypothetical protein
VRWLAKAGASRRALVAGELGVRDLVWHCRFVSNLHDTTRRQCLLGNWRRWCVWRWQRALSIFPSAPLRRGADAPPSLSISLTAMRWTWSACVPFATAKAINWFVSHRPAGPLQDLELGSHPMMEASSHLPHSTARASSCPSSWQAAPLRWQQARWRRPRGAACVRDLGL